MCLINVNSTPHTYCMLGLVIINLTSFLIYIFCIVLQLSTEVKNFYNDIFVAHCKINVFTPENLPLLYTLQILKHFNIIMILISDFFNFPNRI